MTSKLGLILTLIAAALVTCVTEFALAQSETKAKSFAVFVASYNLANDDVRGGVAGTAFFVSPKKAITAYHVLQEKSFRPLPGFDQVRVWLVHENEAPIELKLSDLKTRPGQDMTEIAFRDARRVRSEFVFAQAVKGAKAGVVESEGFRAESTGPVLARVNGRIQVVAVPHLQRLVARGQLLRSVPVELKADDVNMSGVNCFEVGFQPIKGMSGGPLVSNGQVIGMNSFADPVSGARTWAVNLGDIK